jgi:hypothetical protein
MSGGSRRYAKADINRVRNVEPIAVDEDTKDKAAYEQRSKTMGNYTINKVARAAEPNERTGTWKMNL